MVTSEHIHLPPAYKLNLAYLRGMLELYFIGTLYYNILPASMVNDLLFGKDFLERYDRQIILAGYQTHNKGLAKTVKDFAETAKTSIEQ